MQWYENQSGQFGMYDYSPAETWRQVVASPYTLGRDEVKALRK